MRIDDANLPPSPPPCRTTVTSDFYRGGGGREGGGLQVLNCEGRKPRGSDTATVFVAGIFEFYGFSAVSSDAFDFAIDA